MIVEEFVPDPVRCAQALLRLLCWEAPINAPEQDQDQQGESEARGAGASEARKEVQP